MTESVSLGEFERAIDRLTEQVVEGNETTKAVLVEAKRTNGRVYTQERTTSELAIRMTAVERQIQENPPLTRRDLWVFMGSAGAIGALVKWLPALLQAGHQAP